MSASGFADSSGLLPSTAVFVLDERLRYTHWSSTAEKLTGIAAEDALGRCIYELFPEAPGSRAEALYFDALRSGQTNTIITRFGKTTFAVTAAPNEGKLHVSLREVGRPDGV